MADDPISNLVPFPNPTKTTLKGLKKKKKKTNHKHNLTRNMRGDRTKFWNTEKSAVTDLTDTRRPNILQVVKITGNQAVLHSLLRY